MKVNECRSGTIVKFSDGCNWVRTEPTGRYEYVDNICYEVIEFEPFGHDNFIATLNDFESRRRIEVVFCADGTGELLVASARAGKMMRQSSTETLVEQPTLENRDRVKDSGLSMLIPDSGPIPPSGSLSFLYGKNW